MRITGNMLAGNMLTNLYSNLKNLNKFQNQLTLNSRLVRISDDPIAAVSAIQIGNDISSGEQYSKNISDSKAWLNVTEDALSQMNEIVKRTGELSIQASNQIYDEKQRYTISQEINELKKEFLSIANTKFAGKYLFGGFNTTEDPFIAHDGTLSYNSIEDISLASPTEIKTEKQQVRRYMLSDSTYFDVSVNGIDLMGAGNDNIYGVFQSFIDDIANGADLGGYVGKFDKMQGKLLTLIADVGGRQTRLDLMDSRNIDENLSLNALQVKTIGIDQAKTITYYKMAETTYNTSLQVGAQIIKLSLADFLR